MDCEIDNLDRGILAALQKDGRRPFTDLARKFNVSSATIHVRVNKMVEAGLIVGSAVLLDREKLGYDVCAFVGINLHNARDYKAVVAQLRSMPEVLEAHFTTGKYNIFLKIIAKSTRGLHLFLIERLQNIPQIQSTETLISLEMPINRNLPLGTDGVFP